jgi:hypothetical protein
MASRHRAGDPSPTTAPPSPLPQSVKDGCRSIAAENCETSLKPPLSTLAPVVPVPRLGEAPLARPRFAGCHVPVDRRPRTARQRCLPSGALNRLVPTKPFSPRAKSAGNESRLSPTPIKQRGPIMAVILNAIYRHFLRSSISGMRKFAAG